MKFDFKLGVLALGTASLLTGCLGGGKAQYDTEWVSFSDEDRENYGFFNPGTGEIMYEDEFDRTPTSIVDGIFIVSESEGTTVYSASDPKTPKPLGDLEELNDAGGVAEGLLPVVRKNSRIEVYSVSASKAELAFTLDPVDGKEIAGCSGRFVEGLLLVTNEDGMTGAVDKGGNLVIPMDYNSLYDMHNGLMIGGKASDDETKYYVINAKGEEVLKIKKGLVPSVFQVYDNGFIVCNNTENQRFVLANVKGEYFTLPKAVQSVNDFVGEYLVFTEDDDYGILKVSKDGESEIVVRAKYDGISLLPWDPAKFVAKKGDDEYLLMDFDGNKLVDFGDDYDAVIPLYLANWKGFVGVERLDNGYEAQFFDTKGEKIKYDGVGELYNVDVDLMHSFYVRSDYFNVNEFITQVSNAISADGLCGYRMGTPVNQYFSDEMAPRNFTSTYWFTPKNECDIKGYRYSSSIRLSGYKRLADWSWDYNYRTTYYFVSDNPIDGMDVTINGPVDLWEKTGDKIKDVIESKGFTVKKEDNSSIQYYTPDRDATLTLSWNSWGGVELKYFKVY